MRKFTHNARLEESESTFLKCTLYRMWDRIVKILQFIPGLNIQGIRDALLINKLKILRFRLSNAPVITDLRIRRENTVEIRHWKKGKNRKNENTNIEIV